MALFGPALPERPVVRRRRVVGAAVAACLGAGVLVALVAAVGPTEVAAALAGVDPRVLAAALVSKVVALACLTQVYRRTIAVAADRTLTTRATLPICLGAFSLTQLLPAGGVAGAIYAARRLVRHGPDRVTATTAILLVSTLHMGTLAVVVGLATTVASLTSGRYAAYALASGGATLLFGAIFVLLHGLATRPAWRSWTVRRIEAWRWRGTPVGRRWTQLLAAPPVALLRLRELRRPVRWSVAAWTADVTVLALLVHAVGGAPPFLAILVAFAAAHLLAGLPTTPGGLGLVEAGLAGTLIAFGMDPAAASVVGLSYRGVHSLFPVLVAAPVVGRRLRLDRRDRVGPAPPARDTSPPGAATVPTGDATPTPPEGDASAAGRAEEVPA